MIRLVFLALYGLTFVIGCATVRVPPEQMPAAPHLRPGGGIVLLVPAAEGVVATEARALASTAAPFREVRGDDIAAVAATCAPHEGAVVRPRLGRRHFATNSGDRNALIIYESAIVVGLPVALISAVSWPWYGEITREGMLDVLPCGSPNAPAVIVESIRLRSTGLGFVSGDQVVTALDAAAERGVIRRLFTTWTKQSAASPTPGDTQ